MLRDGDTKKYWIYQCAFWFLFAVIPFMGLTLWYGNYEWKHMLHIFAQAVIGLFLSAILGEIYQRIWKMPLFPRMVLVVFSAAMINMAWTYLRILTFIWLTGETHMWREFGGWYFGAFYIYLSWAAIFHGIKYYKLLAVEHRERLREAASAKEELYRRLKAESIAQEANLKMLRYQINPHFLFNVLNSIYALIRLNDPDKAMAMTKQLGRFLRYSLDYDPGQITDLEQEIETLNVYLEIEKTRFPDRLIIHYDIDERAKKAKLPSMLLQPLVENAIKHAIADSETGGRLDIAAWVENGELCLEVTDDGPGIPIVDGFPVLGQGVGLRNTIDRLKTLYEDQCSIVLRPVKPNGLKINIKIPYEQTKDL